MINLEMNWKSLKALWWDPFKDVQVYLDDLDNIFVLKENEDSYILVGYAHITGSMFFIDGIVSFIKDIQKIAEVRWPQYKLKIVINFPLSKIKSSSALMELPKNVEYYFYNYKSYIKLIPAPQNLQREIEFWKRIESTPRGGHIDGFYCNACQESPCMCSDPEHTGSHW